MSLSQREWTCRRMASVAQIVPQYAVPQNKPTTAPEWQGLLNHLRMIALECRVAAREDLFQACALLSTKGHVARDAHARALMKCLRQAVDAPVIFYRPGSAQVSFDEAWLMRALSCKRAGDDDSFAFLIRSRVSRLHQRQVAFLLAGISEQFALF